MPSKGPVTTISTQENNKSLPKRKNVKDTKTSTMSGLGRMQLRTRTVVSGSVPKSRIRSQTVTKSCKLETIEATLPEAASPQIIPGTPEPLTASTPQPASRTVTKKPLATAAKQIKKIPNRIPRLGLNSPKLSAAQVHHDPPTSANMDKVSKIPRSRASGVNEASTRVFRESKQFSPSPARSPHGTPRRLSILHATFDKENTPPAKSSPKFTAVKLTPTLVFSPKESVPATKKTRSQLPRRKAAKSNDKDSKDKGTRSVSSVSGSDTDRSANCSKDKDTDQSANGSKDTVGGCTDSTKVTLNKMLSFEKRDNLVKDLSGSNPLSESGPKELRPTEFVKRDIFAKFQPGWNPLSQSTPKEPAELEIVDDSRQQSATIDLADAEGDTTSVCSIVCETPGFSSGEKVFMKFHNHRMQNLVSSNKSIKTSIPTPKKASSKIIRHPNTAAPPVLINDSGKLCQPESTVISSIMNRPQAVHTPVSIPSSKLSFVPAAVPEVSRVVTQPSTYHMCLPVNKLQVMQPHGGASANFATCSLHRPGNLVTSVSAHTSVLCASTLATTTYHTSLAHKHNHITAPSTTSTTSCYQDVLPTSSSRLSVFANPSLAHLADSNNRHGPSTDNEQLDEEVEALTQGRADCTTVNHHRTVVNPIASDLEGDFTKYTFEPIHVPSRRVLQHQGSAFQRIMIC